MRARWPAPLAIALGSLLLALGIPPPAAGFTFPTLLNTNAESDSGSDARPSIATDGADTWVAVWDSDDSLASIGGALGTDLDILVARSGDGSTWSSPAALNTNAGSDSGEDFGPSIASDGVGNWVAVWHSNDSLGATLGTDADILFAISSDGGITWSAPAGLNSNAGSDSGDDASPGIATDGAGTWIAVWQSTDSLGGTIGSDPDILFSIGSCTLPACADLGWSQPSALSSAATTDSTWEADPRIATDGAGNWIVVWWSEKDPLFPPLIGDIWVARSSDDGANWTSPLNLNIDAFGIHEGGANPDIAFDGASTWLAVWEDFNIPQGLGSDAEIVFSRSVNSGANWTPAAALNTNAATDSGDDVRPSVATDGAGVWAAVWESTDSLGGAIGSDRDIVVARSADDGATWTSPAALDVTATSDSGRDSRPAVVTNGAGTWVAVWDSTKALGSSGTDEDILVAPCAPPTCETVTVQLASGGGSVTTDGEGDGATATDPLETTLSSPVSGPIALTEIPFAGPFPSSGFIVIDQVVLISAPELALPEFFTIFFEIDASLVQATGAPPGQIAVFKGGGVGLPIELIGDCGFPVPIPDPDPCVFSRIVEGDGDLRIGVVSSSASVWTFGSAQTVVPALSRLALALLVLAIAAAALAALSARRRRQAL